MAYRLVATPGWAAQAAARLDPALVAALRAVQAARGAGERGERRACSTRIARWAEARSRSASTQAVEALGWPLASGAVRAVVAALVDPGGAS